MKSVKIWWLRKKCSRLINLEEEYSLDTADWLRLAGVYLRQGKLKEHARVHAYAVISFRKQVRAINELAYTKNKLKKLGVEL